LCLTDGVHSKFVGKEKDRETGLYYFGARYMRPETGRFISVDPAGILEKDLINPQKLNRYAYALNNPYRYFDPDGRYERDVHYNLTYYLAVKAGFSKNQARIIASANQGVDESKVTGPFAGVQARRDYHFVTQERLRQMYDQAYKTGDLELMGQFFHAFQDSYSHAGYEPKRGHIIDGTAPDKTYNDPEKANEMAKATYEYMIIFVKRQGGNPTNNWDAIKDKVDQFNRARSIREKEKILAE